MSNYYRSLIESNAVSDANAQAFLLASGITDTTISNAINTLVLTLKALGLWGKIYFMHPMAGGNSTSCSINLINPATYQITFYGGWTFSATGATPNGIDAYAETNFVPLGIVAQNSSGYDYYSRTNNTTTNTKVIMGCAGSNFVASTISSIGPVSTYWALNDYNFPVIPVSGSLGLLSVNRIGSTNSAFFVNTTKTTVTEPSIGVPNRSIVLGANKSAAIQQYSSYECALAAARQGFTDTEMTNYNNAIQAFQTSLGRNV